MNTFHVVNIKCGGCEQKIVSALMQAGMENVAVDTALQRVTCVGDPKIAAKILADLGYPEQGTKEARSLLRKGVSYLSCAIGRLGI